MTMRASLLSLALAGLVAGACSKGTGGASLSPATSSGALAVELKDARLTLAEVDTQAQAQLQQLRQQEYDARRQVLDRWLSEQLFKREASARGLTVEVLSRSEVDAKVPSPASGQVEAFYQTVRSQLGGQTLEAVRPQLEEHLRQQAVRRRSAEFRRELSRKYQVRIYLDPPRRDVKVAVDAASLGPAAAPVQIVAYTDFQCPYCRRAEQTVEELLKSYKDRVRFVHRDFPLENHAGAVPAARSALCAGEQGKFWEFRRSLLMEVGDLGDADLKRRAENLRLDPTAFTACLASQRHADAVAASLEEGRGLGVSATPTFFVNGRQISGALPYENFVDLIEDELALSSS